MNPRGFTLLELIAVIALVAILAAVAVPQYQKSLQRTRNDLAVATLKAIASAERVYKLDNNKYGNASELGDLVDPGWNLTDLCTGTYQYCVQEAEISAFKVRAALSGTACAGVVVEINESGTLTSVGSDPASNCPVTDLET